MCVSSDVTIESRINSSDVQCRQPSVWSVYVTFEHTFLPELFFLEGMRGVHNTCANYGGVGGYFCVRKMEIWGGGELR